MMNKFGFLVLVFLAGLLVACGQDEVIEEVVLVTKTAVPPTIPSPTTTYTPTPSPTQTAVPTKPPTATATATATTIPTLTPLPTFAPEELETAVADLLANPMNCDVPCWWGVIPGETTVFEVQQFLDMYQYLDYFKRDNDYDQILDYIELESSKGLFDFNVRYGFENAILKSVTSFQSPALSNVIKMFSQPDEVLISAENDPRQQPPLIRIMINYLQQGISVGYAVDGEFQDDVIKGCFFEEKTGRLNLVAPGVATSYKDFTTFNEELSYLPLEEATNLTMAEFMEKFSDPTQPQCLETSTELWD